MFYFDSAYVAKCYLNEPDSEGVRDLVRTPAPLFSSVICIVEVSSAIHWKVREKSITRRQALEISDLFRANVESGVWTLIPASERLLWEVHQALCSLPATISLRSADAIHLISARTAGLGEIWTSDQHVLGAAAHFGLKGRSA